MNNKRLGTQFEREICEKLAKLGYWVHFLAPDARGAQPFDIIVVRDGIAHAIDCKTCVANTFSINRLEENQVTAFERWMKCGNTIPIVAVKHDGKIYAIEYTELKERKSIKLNERGQWL